MSLLNESIFLTRTREPKAAPAMGLYDTERRAMILKDQPAYIIKMRAKSGTGDRLFELATASMTKSGASDRFIILREDGNPDILLNIEVFRSDAAKDAYENSPLADELRDEIIELLAEPSMRIAAHPYSAAPR